MDMTINKKIVRDHNKAPYSYRDNLGNHGRWAR